MGTSVSRSDSLGILQERQTGLSRHSVPGLLRQEREAGGGDRSHAGLRSLGRPNCPGATDEGRRAAGGLARAEHDALRLTSPQAKANATWVLHCYAEW